MVKCWDRYHPSRGYWWHFGKEKEEVKIPGPLVRSIHPGYWNTQVRQQKKKEEEKEEPSSFFQRRRVSEWIDWSPNNKTQFLTILWRLICCSISWLDNSQWEFQLPLLQWKAQGKAFDNQAIKHYSYTARQPLQFDYPEHINIPGLKTTPPLLLAANKHLQAVSRVSATGQRRQVVVATTTRTTLQPTMVVGEKGRVGWRGRGRRGASNHRGRGLKQNGDWDSVMSDWNLKPYNKMELNSAHIHQKLRKWQWIKLLTWEIKRKVTVNKLTSTRCNPFGQKDEIGVNSGEQFKAFSFV